MLHPIVPRTLLCSSLATLMITLAPGAANASDAATATIRKSIAVRISDLDLSRPADAATLYRRIRRAAERVCGDGLSSGSPIAAEPQRDCMQNAIADAVAALKQPLVTAAYLRNGGVAASRAGA